MPGSRAMSPPIYIAHYRITTKLGKGGMGEVWRATDTNLNRDVAIKILPDAFGDRPHSTLRTKHGCWLRSIIRISPRSTVLRSGRWYGTGGGADARRETRSWAIPLEDVLCFETDRRALEYAHGHGIIHRDQKPSISRWGCASSCWTTWRRCKPQRDESQLRPRRGRVSSEPWHTCRLSRRPAEMQMPAPTCSRLASPVRDALRSTGVS
jgi:hypothetical protein